MSRPIGRVLVAGGGTVGWAAAAALKRRVPQVAVSLLALPPPPGALADHLACALPSTLGFLGDLGVGPLDGVVRAGSGYRLGTRFRGWTGAGSAYVHGYGPVGRTTGATAFHLLWLRAAAAGAVPPFDDFSAAALLGAAGRMPADAAFAGTEPGLTLTPPGFHTMLRALARHAGVEEVTGTLAAVEQGAGRLEALRLDDGRRLTADLFVDATGPDARLRRVLGGAWEDWRRWLPCDRLLLAGGPPPATAPLLAEADAVAAGWRWQAASPQRAEHGLAYAGAWLTDAAAADLLDRPEPMAAPVGAGIWTAPWQANCVAVGDAAVQLDPLEWCPLHLALGAIDRIVTLLPGVDCAPVELAEYNRQVLAEARRARDFVVLHYATADRPEPFWREAAATPPPETLAHSLALFAERGRLPFYPEETFAADGWATVLIGQGRRPRRVDALAALLPAGEMHGALAHLAGALAAALPAQPTHAAFLAAHRRPLAP